MGVSVGAMRLQEICVRMVISSFPHKQGSGIRNRLQYLVFAAAASLPVFFVSVHSLFPLLGTVYVKKWRITGDIFAEVAWDLCNRIAE